MTTNTANRASSRFSATSTGSASHSEAIISSLDGRQHWMIQERGETDPDFDSAEERPVDRFAIFSSPSVFWAATICLAVATTILLGLICTFILIVFRKRNKLANGRSGPTPGNLYSSAGESTRAQMSACLTVDPAALPSNDSKILRLGPYSGRIRILISTVG